MREKYSWAREAVILSSDPEAIQRWEAPFFEQPTLPVSPSNFADREALAQASGFQAGKEEGMEVARIEAKDLVTRMTSLAEEMAKPFKELDALVTKELAQMATLLAKQIVRRELSVDSSVVTDVVVEAMSTLYKLEGEIVIFLNPQDAESVRALKPEFLDGKSWKVVEDPGLFPGGCQVKTPTSFVDASVEKQMEVIFAKLIDSCENKPEPGL